MHPDNRNRLESRVRTAAQAALERQGYVSAIDVLCGIGWLDPATLKRWRFGQLRCLEEGIQTNLRRITEATRLFRNFANTIGLRPSETAYVTRDSARTRLVFSKGGHEDIERAYRTHWVSPELSNSKRMKLEDRVSRPPELVVIQPTRDWTCHACGGSGGLLMMQPKGPACLECAGLADLEFLPSGDAAATRKARAISTRYAVVVRFSIARKRYERQGLLVEPRALGSSEDPGATRHEAESQS